MTKIPKSNRTVSMQMLKCSKCLHEDKFDSFLGKEFNKHCPKCGCKKLYKIEGKAEVKMAHSGFYWSRKPVE